MAIPTKTRAQWVTRALANFRTSFEGWPLGTKKFLGRMSRAIGSLGWQLHKAVEDVDRDIVPSAKSSEDALNAWAEELGLPDGDGGYGKLKPVAATGGEADLTGVKGTIYPLGATATAEDGETQVELTGGVTIPGSAPGFGSVAGSFVAVTAGAAGNLPIGTKLTWDSQPAGADAQFELTTALEGGADTESNAAVFARIVSRLQTPPRGGVEEDFRVWAATFDGIRAWVFPKRSGTGTVDVVITQAGTGSARVPSEAQRAEVDEYIDTKRPANCDGVNVMVPTLAATGHDVRVRVVESSSRYAFDWDDDGSTRQVDAGGYSGGPPATLRLANLAPASLKAAIDSYVAGTGLAPRLQVMSTGRVVNDPIRAVAYSDGGGKTTLTLESVPSTWTAPLAGDKVYPYGPVVATIAAGIVALCDSLGPSRSSGFGDALTPWNDTLAISGIIAVAEQAIDTDGTELIQKVPVGYATIDNIAGDVRAGDGNNGAPELLYLRSVAVTK